MKKLFLSLLCCLFAWGLGMAKVEPDKQFISIFNNACEIEVYNVGNKEVYDKTSSEFKNIMKNFKILLEGGHEMPAFGVSTNDTASDIIKNGEIVIQFIFIKEQKHQDMGYSRLLIQIEPNYSGFNIVRYTTEYQYMGRCFYYDLDKDTSVFYEFMKTEIIK